MRICKADLVVFFAAQTFVFACNTDIWHCTETISIPSLCLYLILKSIKYSVYHRAQEL